MSALSTWTANTGQPCQAENGGQASTQENNNYQIELILDKDEAVQQYMLLLLASL